MYKKTILFCLALYFTSSCSQASGPSSYGDAKKLLPNIYKSMQETIYCGCSYSYKGNKKVPNHQSCGYKIRKEQKRAGRVEWEHIVPSEHSGRGRSCWRDRAKYPQCRKSNGKLIYGRKCCNKVDPEFRKLSGNLHNLAPAIGEVNGVFCPSPRKGKIRIL
jgi:deoxyribonuclease I